MSFAENLQALPDATGARVRLRDLQGIERGVIENAPDTAGSFKLYAHLARQYGRITPEAAAAALALYAEHADDARLHPGKHPNIDRLLDCIATQSAFDASVE